MPADDKWGWKHVSVFGGFDKGSGTKRWKCNHCNQQYNGSYSRVRAHLLGFSGLGVKSCPAIDRSLRESFQTLEAERLGRKTKKVSAIAKSGKRIKSSPLALSSPLKTLSKEDLDDIIARFVYADGLNVNIINSPYFQEMTSAIAAFGPGYEPPSPDKLSGSLLSKEKVRVEKAISLVKESWPHTGCTILCVNRLDGSLGCFCINLFVASPRGVMFLRAIDVNEDDEADNLFINVLSTAIIEADPTNVLQIITHLGQASGAFESVILSKFPRIFWSHCTSHSIQVLMEEIAELDWMKPVVLCAKGIEHCILNYQRSLSHSINNNVKDCCSPLSLKFAPSYCLVKRLFSMKDALEDLVVREDWKVWKLSFVDDALTVEAAVLGDDFWSRADLMLKLCEPFLTFLATMCIEKSIMGDVFHWRVRSLEVVRSRGIDDIALNQLEFLIENRWDSLFSPLHSAGYILNPRYFGKGQSKDKAVMRGWKAVLDRYECNNISRRVLREQLSSYLRLEGSLGEEDAVECRDKMDPVAWWENFGSETPELQTLAIKILSQVCSVTMCQESWQYNNLPCREAITKLGVERVDDLAFVQNNLRLQSQKNGHASSLYASNAGSSCCGSGVCGSGVTT